MKDWIIIGCVVYITAIFSIVIISSVAFGVEAGTSGACYSRLDDYFKERLEHINDTNYNIAYPCPEFDKSHIPKDNSLK